ncbi:MAG: flippase-like domain-containing protein [Elusimicrobiota bacterium]|jgi:uncharacterized protein (TIRG00374 family)|nr:flippase-like domain-containing protein [Elusimicrobiota bacterium]
MFKKHFLKILLGCLISAVLIYLTFRNIDFPVLWGYIKDTKYYILILAAILSALTYAARSARYFFIILPIKKTRFFENFPYTVLGFFMNNIIPLRLGEVIRAKVTGERLKISRSSALATIVVERLMDIIVYVLFFFLIMNTLPFPVLIKRSFFICAAVFGIMLIVLFIVSIYDAKALKAISKFPLPLKLKELIVSLSNKFIDGLGILKSKKALATSFIFSFIVWIVESMSFIVVAYACGIQLSLIEGIFTVIIIGIAGIIPTAPGYLGAFEMAGLAALSVLGIEENSALACILIYHAMQLIVNFTLGFSVIIFAKISLADLFKFDEIKMEEENNVR